MKKEYVVYKLSECAKQACRIDNELFTRCNVKRGLRNEDGTGVLVGLTKWHVVCWRCTRSTRIPMISHATI